MASDDDLTDDQLLTVPGEAMPRGRLAEYFARRATVVHDRAFAETMLELSGDSTRHLMIFADQDPRVKRRMEEEGRRRAWTIAQEMADRQRRLLLLIEQQQAVVRKRLDDIDSRTIRLHDGRRVYVDGSRYVDGEGRALTGADEAEAREQHAENPHASTAQEKAEADRDWQELERLRQAVAAHPEAVGEYEKQVQAAKPEVKADDYGSDYMSAYAGPAGGEGKAASPAFASAVSPYENASREAVVENTQENIQKNKSIRPV